QCWRAWLSENKRGRLAVVVHAFREEYFAALFRQNAQGSPVMDGKPVWLVRQKLLEYLSEEGAALPLLCAGSGEKGAPLSQALAGTGLNFAPHEKSVLDVATLLRLAVSSGKCARFIEPLYLKPAKYELL
ncbi:MAG TPA: hypothetical protein PLL10_01215, partial [Elusimicrobiales bacterium]|nr:hypothetical protein [Elusimicrobiales bacterium]